MGVKVEISISQLPFEYQKYNLIPTIDGVSSSVYLLDDKYVLKLFEESVESEIELLNSIQDLPIPQIVDRFKIDDYDILIYTQIEGNSISNPTNIEIIEIAKFLKEFHSQTSNLSIKFQNRFAKDRLKEMIYSTKNSILLKYFNSISINLREDGIIHGDIFLDNVKFKDNILSGVYDFSDASVGDFHFELAVVVIDWCFDGDILDRDRVLTLLKYYQSNIDLDKFIEYIKYALLYYATTRYISSRNSSELIRRLEIL